MITIRRMTIDDLGLGIKLGGQAGWNQTEADWRRFIELEPEGCFVGELNGVTGELAEARIDGALQAVGLFDEAEKKIGAYSRGMRQRLGIAELLIKDSKVAFLDEPTLGLDPDATNRMIELIQSLARDKQMTILLSSHMLHQVQKICHRIGIMIKGKMVAQGPMEQLAKEKFGVGSEKFSLEEIYMKYFQEA